VRAGAGEQQCGDDGDQAGKHGHESRADFGSEARSATKAHLPDCKFWASTSPPTNAIAKSKKPEEACVSHGDQNRRFKTLGQSENARKSRGNLLIPGCSLSYNQTARHSENAPARRRHFLKTGCPVLLTCCWRTRFVLALLGVPCHSVCETG